MGRTQRRRRVEPTDDWEQLALLCLWPEQRAYEEIRPLTLFGNSVAQRAAETGTPERTLYRKVGRFEEEGMESLFATETARRRRLPPAMRRLILDLKAEHPGFNPNEIANVCYVRFGRRPDRKTVTACSPMSRSLCGTCAAFHPTTRCPRGRSAGSRWSRCTPRGGAPRP